MTKIPLITVHGRFQPPLHKNHWAYVSQGFELATRVEVLITNPDLDEAHEATADWRNRPESNPFSYNERIKMFAQFFTRMGISPTTYHFVPFNIKEDASFARLKPKVPNLVNDYSEWSAKKVALFEGHGLDVVRLDNVKVGDVSGTMIREIISSTQFPSALPERLVHAGFMPEAVPGLMQVLANRAANSQG